MRLKCFVNSIIAFLLVVGFVPIANAQIDREKTKFTIGEPLDVGGTILPPGSYLIRIVRLSYNRSVV